MLHSLARTCRTTAGLCRHPPLTAEQEKNHALFEASGRFLPLPSGSAVLSRVRMVARRVWRFASLRISAISWWFDQFNTRDAEATQDIQIQTSSGHHHCLAYQTTQASFFLAQVTRGDQGDIRR